MPSAQRLEPSALRLMLPRWLGAWGLGGFAHQVPSRAQLLGRSGLSWAGWRLCLCLIAVVAIHGRNDLAASVLKHAVVSRPVRAPKDVFVINPYRHIQNN